MTSHDLVDEARKIFKVRRIGHGGTLDPGASGILPLAIGKATRLFEYLEEAKKTYRGEITFGAVTSTQDAQGNLIEKKDASQVTQERIEALLPQFMGEVEQIPPQVSAIRHQGKRSYEWERAGVVVPLTPRKVRIDRIVFREFFPGVFPKAILDVWSGPGMYMRALARDLGEALGSGAHLSFLVRLESTPFGLSEAHTIEEVRKKATEGGLESILVGGEKALPHIPKVSISEQQKLLLLRGSRLPMESPLVGKPLVQLYDEEEDLVALGRIEGSKKPYFFQPVKIFD